MNNVFAEDYAALSGDSLMTNIKTNKNVGDIYTTYDRLNNYNKNQYQMYLEMDSLIKNGKAQFKNVFFKGSFPESSFIINPPSGDFAFRRFFKSYIDNSKAKAAFGDAYTLEGEINVNYDIDSKDFVIWADYEDDKNYFYGKTKFNSENGHFQEFSLESKPIDRYHLDDIIKYSFHREYDKELNHLPENDVLIKNNIRPIGDLIPALEPKLLIEDTDTKNKAIKIINCVKSFWSSINLQEKENNIYEMIIEDPQVNEYLIKKDIKEVPFRSFKMLGQTFKDENFYQILCNRYLYIILKISKDNPDDVDIYDLGLSIPMKFCAHNALIYEVMIPESRELLGLNFIVGL